MEEQCEAFCVTGHPFIGVTFAGGEAGDAYVKAAELTEQKVLP